ncbi:MULTISPECIES: hypothetical protein [Chelativorans]|jgi:hypothetical protein|nr:MULTISPECIES: hypothetical protein [Chelativorans]
MDPRVKPEDDEEERFPHITSMAIGGYTPAIVILGLDPRIHA